ncbi:MAG TPA: hypothetical protein VMX33_03645 [bacterium]|nr:hypothetical protein [bacterium]
MIIMPGLTSTKKERIPAFIAALRLSTIRHIALFPTCLTVTERRSLYDELETIPGLGIPHVHLRSDCGLEEIEYLAGRFGTQAFNIHPRASSHAFGPLPVRFADRLYIENVDIPAEDAELFGDGGPVPGGLCPDFSHLENARLFGEEAYVSTVSRQLKLFVIGCCHISAVRVGVPNHWAGMWDHHEYACLADLDYLVRYRDNMPGNWASLELENGFDQQLQAIRYLEELLSRS